MELSGRPRINASLLRSIPSEKKNKDLTLLNNTIYKYSLSIRGKNKRKKEGSVSLRFPLASLSSNNKSIKSSWSRTTRPPLFAPPPGRYPSSSHIPRRGRSVVARISENVEATKEQTDAADDRLSVTKSGRDRFENGGPPSM